jgi:transaldolase
MIYEGRNINVTLIFSVERYREVADAYITGLERRMKEGRVLDSVASVASVFVSRIDTLVDDLLMKKDPDAYQFLLGKAAVANSKLVYRAFKEIFGSPRFRVLEAGGARVQRPLWGSTGTKNPAYSDLLYVDTLIGPHTVNTVPPQTYAAILSHGKPALTLESDLENARRVLDDIAATGVDLTWVMKKLEDDGVTAFEKSFDSLCANLSKKRGELVETSAPTV